MRSTRIEEALLDRSALRPRSMRVLLENAWESRSPLPRPNRRVDGDAYVAPSRPKDINAADAVVMKVRGDCTRYGKSNLLFNLREVPLCFSHPTLYQSKATHHHHGQ